MPGFNSHDLLGLAPGADRRLVEARIASLRRELQGPWPHRLRLWLVGVDAAVLDRAAAVLVDPRTGQAPGRAPLTAGPAPPAHYPWL